MSEDFSSDLLLGRFTDFYEEVVRLKLAIQEGKLALYLSGGEEAPASGEPQTAQAEMAALPTSGLPLLPMPAGVALLPAPAGPGAPELPAAAPVVPAGTHAHALMSGAQMAAMVSGRLQEFLAQAAKEVRADSTEAEYRTYLVAQYVMAALADEIFILELRWPGRGQWLHWLLEQSLFGTRMAGSEFFAQADRLLRAGPQTPLHIELAAVFLLALRLGFRGQHRGPQGEAALRAYSERLLKLVHARGGHDSVGFPQAYYRPQSGKAEQRVTPLRNWYLAGALGAALYLAVSTSIWFFSLQPFYAEFGMHGPPSEAPSAAVKAEKER